MPFAPRAARLAGALLDGAKALAQRAAPMPARLAFRVTFAPRAALNAGDPNAR